MNVVEIGLLLISCIVLLFCAYCLSREDFLLVRKNILLEQVFNVLLSVLGISFLFSRFVYVLFHFNSRFLNPLVFFTFFYFPGLSLAGAIIGGLVSILLLCMNTKIPTARFLDIISLSFLASYGVGYYPLWFSYSAIQGHFQIVYALACVAYFLLFCGVLWLFLKSMLKDGSTTALVLSSFTFFYILFSLFDKTVKRIPFLEQEGFLFGVLFLVSLVYLVKVERIYAKIGVIPGFIDDIPKRLKRLSKLSPLKF